jgi:hypothetical protein
MLDDLSIEGPFCQGVIRKDDDPGLMSLVLLGLLTALSSGVFHATEPWPPSFIDLHPLNAMAGRGLVWGCGLFNLMVDGLRHPL